MTSDPEQLMKHLKRGFGRADRDELALAISDDFEWHMHWQTGPDDAPTGKVLRGLDQVMHEIGRRQRDWSDLRYDDMTERYLDDLVVQTFVVSGIDSHGKRFSNAAVDLYEVRDGRLANKRTYWKQQPGGANA